MFHVRDLDSRDREITTGSERMASEFWAAILVAHGTPYATRSGAPCLLGYPAETRPLAALLRGA